MTGPTSPTFSEDVALASAIEIVGADGAVKRKFLALPYGDPIPTRDGRGPYILRGQDHAEAVIAATKAFLRGCDMMIDYDHQAHYASEGKGNQAPAAGWVKDLVPEDDGVHVVVDWTPAAEKALAAREYRYVSPDFRVAKDSRLVTRMVRVGLTNSPNMELPALAHSQGGAPAGDDPTMSKTLMISTAGIAALAAALAVSADDLDEAKVLAGVGDLTKAKDGSEAALASIRSELGTADDAGAEVVLAAISSAKKAGKPDPTQYVPREGYDQLAARLGKLEEDRVIAMVDGAPPGKVSPAIRDWLIDIGRSDEAALAAYLERAPTIVEAGAQIKGDPKPEKGKLTDEEKAICAMQGLTEDAFLQSRDAMLEEAA